MRSKYHDLLKREQELDEAERQREQNGREKKKDENHKKFNPFTFSGTEDKFDDDYEDFKGFIQVD